MSWPRYYLDIGYSETDLTVHDRETQGPWTDHAYVCTVAQGQRDPAREAMAHRIVAALNLTHAIRQRLA